MHICPDSCCCFSVEVSRAQISVLPLITLLWHRLEKNTPFLPPKNKGNCCLCSAPVHQFKMAFCLIPLVSWRWGLIWESLAWYVLNICLRLNCQVVSKSLITRQQREAVLSGSYHFYNIHICVFMCIYAVCSLMNFAMGRDHCKIFDLNAENCNLKVVVNDTQTISVIFRVFLFFLISRCTIVLRSFFLFLFFFSSCLKIFSG